MNKLTGKTYSIINRLPHFYQDSDNALLVQLLEIFSQRLEKAETDLYNLHRAHHVETADNQGMTGYIAPAEQRGDMDKIFTLFLEALGGTSQLVKVSPKFTIRSIDIKSLSRVLAENEQPIIEYVRTKLTDQLVDLLDKYYIGYAQFSPNEIGACFAQHLLLGNSHVEEKSPVSKYIKKLLLKDSTLAELLDSYGGEDEISANFSYLLSEFLNKKILTDPSLYSRNKKHFLEIINQNYSNVDIVNDEVIGEIQKKKYYRKIALYEYIEIHNTELKLRSDDIIRFNRMLLGEEYEFNSSQTGFVLKDIPCFELIQTELLKELNILLYEQDLFQKEYFSEMEDDFTYLKERHKDNIVWFNRGLFEKIFPGEIEKSHTPYRERMQAMIKVLLNGASTKEGILDIVAANLGIIGDSVEAKDARDLIEIEEYDPKSQVFYNDSVTFYEEFTINNSNPHEETPEFRITISSGIERGFAEISIINAETNESIDFEDNIKKAYIKDKNTIVFKNNHVYINEVKIADFKNISIPSGESRWRFEAKLYDEDKDVEEDIKDQKRLAGRFDSACTFDDSSFVTDEDVVDINVLSPFYTPGVFKVLIPWHIKGFTDVYTETPDHPRHQILSLVNKVKAAGVQASVSYFDINREDHNIIDKLSFKINGKLFQQKHDIEEEYDFASSHGIEEDHDVDDVFEPAGRFDYTAFDSLNTFK